jgi:hypothetical protein
MADVPSELEARAIGLAIALERMGDKAAADVLRRLAAANGDLRRAVVASRVWWTDDDRYREPWDHRADCRCAACGARALAMRALAMPGADG